MNRVKEAIKKWLAIATLAIYIFISLSHIFFLPKYSLPKSDGRLHTRSFLVSFHSDKLHHDHNSHILFQRISKSTTESKRNRSAALFFSVAVVVTFILKYTIPGPVKGGYVRGQFLVPRQYAYLNFCTLRI